MKEDPYANENFATFEPDCSDDDEVYEEDFDEYDDNFEDVEFETKKQQEERLEKEEKAKRGEKENKNPSPDEDWEAIQDAIKRENSQVSLYTTFCNEIYQTRSKKTVTSFLGRFEIRKIYRPVPRSAPDQIRYSHWQ